MSQLGNQEQGALGTAGSATHLESSKETANSHPQQGGGTMGGHGDDEDEKISNSSVLELLRLALVKGDRAPSWQGPKLRDFLGKDYLIWSKQSKVCLSQNDLWDVVERPVPGVKVSQSVIYDHDADEDPSGDADTLSVNSGVVVMKKTSLALVAKSKLAYSYIFSALRAEQVLLVGDVPEGNAHLLWKRLKEHYSVQSDVRIEQLNNQLMDPVQGKNESISSFTIRIKSVVDELEVLGETLNKKIINSRFLKGVLPVYNGYKDILKSSDSWSTTTLDKIAGKLLAKEQELLADGALNKSGTGSSSGGSQALAAATGKEKKEFKPKGNCFKCGGAGHVAKFCRNKKQNNADGNKKDAPNCTHCGKVGHLIAQCWIKNPDLKPKAATFLAEAQAYMAATRASEESTKTIVWNLDSGATDHMATKGITLSNQKVAQGGKKVINTASGKLLNPSVGDVHVQPSVGVPIVLSDALQHEGLHANLMSVSKICAKGSGNTVTFDEDKATAFNSKGQALFEAYEVGGLYRLKQEVTAMALEASTAVNPKATAGPISESVTVKAQLELQELWHKRLIHLPYEAIETLVKSGCVTGLEKFKFIFNQKHDLCVGCIKGKAHRHAFGKKPSERRKATKCLERVHMDNMGPMQIASLGGSFYVLLIIDEYSRKVWCYFLKTKDETTKHIMDWSRMVMAQTGLKILEMHSDGGKEFNNKELDEFYRQLGITKTLTTPHTPQHNAIAERMNRTIMEAASSLLYAVGAPPCLWAEAVQIAVTTRNIVGVRKNEKNLTPELLWKPESKPTVNYIKVPFCDAWVHIPDANRKKLDAKSKLYMYVGQEADGQGTRLLDVSTGKVYRSRDVTFDENKFTQCQALFNQEMKGADGKIVENYDFYEFVESEQEDAEIALAKILSLEDLKGQPKPVAALAPAIKPQVINQPAIKSPAVDSKPPDSGNKPIVAEEHDFIHMDSASITSDDMERKYDDNQDEVKENSSKSSEILQAIPLDGTANQPLQAKVIKSTDDSVTVSESVAKPKGKAKFKDDESVSSDSINNPEVVNHEPRTTRAGRVVRPTNIYGKVNYGDVAGVVNLLTTTEIETGTAAAFMASSYIVSTNIADEPKTLTEALAGPDKEGWKGGLSREVTSIRKSEAFEEAVLPPGRSAIPTGLTFKKKIDVEGKLAIYKNRIVVKGFKQIPGIDYINSFAPTLSYTTLRVLFALVAALDYEFKQMDVDTAFLNSVLKEVIYITLPKGLASSGIPGTEGLKEGQVYLLKKSLYGLVQAPHDWNELIDKTITSIGYTRCKTDTCVYIKRSRTNRLIIIPLFVDDMFPMYHKEDEAEWEADKKQLMSTYKMKDLGDAQLILGMRITRDREAKTLKVDLEVYIKRLLESVNMENVIPMSTPGDPTIKFTAKTDDVPCEDMFNTGMNSIIGSLLYAALSARPDIAHSVITLARFVSNPSTTHWKGIKRILQYLKGTAALGLIYRGNAKGTLTIGPMYVDANWSSDLDDRKSTTGVVMKINGCAVSWKSKKQAVVSLSSAESEYMALGESTREALWLRQLLFEFKQCIQDKIDVHGAITILIRSDNTAAISIAKNDVVSNRVKHIDIRHHFLRDHIKDEHISLEWVSTQDQEADILTKALGANIFTKLRNRVMGYEC